ncbi:MAG: PorT family protein [Muribaculum sp.]|nr:PorT family protein [Muribaculaceae bacterium]MCM1080713.1 PorT family protein [Muribaculum sp.]
MKKHISLIILLVLLVGTFSAKAQFRYGPMVGVNLTNLQFSQRLFDVDQSVGFQAGVATEVMFPGIGFGVNSGLIYEMRGAKLHLGQREIWASQNIGTERSYLHYLAVPINLRFKWTRMSGLEDYVAPYIYGGPVFSLLVGHSKISALDYARGDVGLTAGLGFEILKNWQVQGSYTWGITYAERTKLLDDFSAKNRSWNLSFIYYFNR